MEPLTDQSTASVMTFIFWALAVLAAVIFLCIGLGVRKRSAAHPGISGLRHVDLVALKNLADSVQTDRLKRTLSKQHFRMLQRHRLRAMLRYVESAAFNAAVLLRLNATLQHSGDPAVAEAARVASGQALNMRLYAMAVVLKLWWLYLFPDAPSLSGVFERYNRLSMALESASRRGEDKSA